MFIDKEFDKLWYSDYLPERIRSGQFEISNYEKKILLDHIHSFYDYIREQRHVPLLDYARFLEFLEMLLETGDESFKEIVSEAWALNSTMRNGLEIDRPIKEYILYAEDIKEMDLREDDRAFEKAVGETGNPDLLTMSVREIDFTSAVKNSLSKAKIETVRDLWILTLKHPKVFAWMRGVGETRIKEIKTKLQELGFVL